VELIDVDLIQAQQSEGARGEDEAESGGMAPAVPAKNLQQKHLSYGPPWAHCLGGYQDRLLGGPLGLPGLCHTAPDGVRCKDYGGEVLG
jgi:hypothetical protein